MVAIMSISPPDELLAMLRRGSQVFIIKGEAGTGKTTLAMEIIRSIEEDGGSGFYLSTRVPIDKIFSQFPWLKELKIEDKILDARKTILPKIDKYFIEFLTSQDFLKVIYSKVSQEKKKPIVIIIDSIDALKADLDIPSEDFSIEKMMVEISGRTGANTIFISEGVKETKLDYIADSIIILRKKYINGRVIRCLELEKTRTTEIKRPVIIFSIKDSRFIHFTSKVLEYPTKPLNVSIPEENAVHVSTLIEEFDKILGGGFEKGSINIIEAGRGVGRDYRWVSAPPALNIVLKKKPAFFIPSEGYSPATVRKWFEPMIGKELYRTYIHVFQFSATGTSSAKNIHVIDWADPVTDYKVIRETTSNVLDELGTEEFFFYIGADTLEHLYGAENLKRIIGRLAKDAKDSSGVFLVVVKTGQRILDGLDHLASTYFKLESLAGITLFYGLLPATNTYSLIIEETEEKIIPKLIPIK